MRTDHDSQLNKLRRLVVLTGFIAVTFVAATAASANTFYLVRHAEKLADGPDPALSACGRARAQALADYISDVKLEAVYATPYQRTQQTAAAVAEQQQLTVQIYDPRDTDALLHKLKEHSKPVLIVGHSNTVPALVTQLSAIDMAPLSEQDYSMLYRVDSSTTNPSVTLFRQIFSCNSSK